MVDHCPAERLLEHFFGFVRKANLDLRLLLHTGMDGRYVKLKFEKFLRSSESFRHINTTNLSAGTCALYITHNGFRSGIAKLDFNVDSFAIDVNFFSSCQLPAEQTTLTLGLWQKLCLIFF